MLRIFHLLLAIFPIVCIGYSSAKWVGKVSINRDGDFVDPSGRVVIFHGLSYVDKGDDLIQVTDDEMFLAANKWGMNVARVGFLWNLLEPEVGVYNQTYLNKMIDLVDRFGKHGIYSILDMHQDCWSTQYCGQGVPDFYALPKNTTIYQKNGIFTFPKPATQPVYGSKPGKFNLFPKITNCGQVAKEALGWPSCYPTFALASASQRLYDNDANIMGRFGDMWELVARNFQNQSWLLGYELLNEPYLGDHYTDYRFWDPQVSDRENLQPLYQYLHKRIRDVDNDSIILFQPTTGGNLNGHVGFNSKPGGSHFTGKEALSFHIYCAYLQNDLNGSVAIRWIRAKLGYLLNFACQTQVAMMMQTRFVDTQRLNVGGLMTEFASIDPNDDDAVASTIFAQNEADRYLQGWMFWYQKPSNQCHPAVEHMLTRTYAKKIAGTPLNMAYHNTTEEFVIRFRPKALISSATTEIYANYKVHYPKGLVCEVSPQWVAFCTQDPASNTVFVKSLQFSKSLTIQVRIYPRKQ